MSEQSYPNFDTPTGQQLIATVQAADLKVSARYLARAMEDLEVAQEWSVGIGDKDLEDDRQRACEVREAIIDVSVSVKKVAVLVGEVRDSLLLLQERSKIGPETIDEVLSVLGR